MKGSLNLLYGKGTMALVGLLSLTLAVGACSDDGNGESGLPGGNDQNQNQPTPDTGLDTDPSPDVEDVDVVEDTGPDADVSDDPDADAGGDTDTGTDEEEYPELIDGPCGPMIALGELEWGADTTLEVDMDDFDNDLHTHCDEAMGDGDVAILRLQTPVLEAGELVVHAEGMVGEMRIGSCHEDGFYSECSVGIVETMLQPGTTYYLLLEPDEQSPQDLFEVQFEFEELPTCPYEDFEMASCVDGALIEVCNVTQYSPDQPRELTVECPSGECVDDRCVGDSCEEPIRLSSSFEWAGRNIGHFNNHNSIDEVDEAGDEATCLIDGDPDFPVNSWGREIVFEVHDLEPGDEIVVTAEPEHPDQLRVLFKQECSSTASCLAVSAGEKVTSYEVEEENKIFVFVDTQFDFDQYFDLSVEVQ